MKAIFNFIRLVVIRAEKFPINKELTARLYAYLFFLHAYLGFITHTQIEEYYY